MSFSAKTVITVMPTKADFDTCGYYENPVSLAKLRVMDNPFLQTEESIIRMLKTVYDPEIPINIYDLGMIYKIEVPSEGEVFVEMTLTAPNCPAADFILEDVRTKLESIEGIKNVTVNIVFEPAWDKDMMSDEAKLDLGFL